MHDQRRVGLTRSDHLIDFSVGLAKDQHGISCGFQSAVGSLLIRNRLFHFSLRNSGKPLDALQFLVGQFESRRGTDQFDSAWMRSGLLIV